MPRKKIIKQLTDLSNNQLVDSKRLSIDYNKLAVPINELNIDERKATVDLVSNIIEYSLGDSTFRKIKHDENIISYAKNQTIMLSKTPLRGTNKIPIVNKLNLRNLAGGLTSLQVGFYIYNIQQVLSNIQAMMSTSTFGHRGIENAYAMSVMKEDYILRALFEGVNDPLIYLRMGVFGIRNTARDLNLNLKITNVEKAAETWKELAYNIVSSIGNSVYSNNIIVKNTVQHFQIDLDTAIDSTDNLTRFLINLTSAIAMIFFIFFVYGSYTKYGHGGEIRKSGRNSKSPKNIIEIENVTTPSPKKLIRRSPSPKKRRSRTRSRTPTRSPTPLYFGRRKTKKRKSRLSI